MFNTILTQQRQVIGTFSSREAAGQALDYLVFSGFPLAQVFLLGQGCQERENSLNLPSDSFGAIAGTATGLKKGMFLGNLVGGCDWADIGNGTLGASRCGSSIGVWGDRLYAVEWRNLYGCGGIDGGFDWIGADFRAS